MCLPHSWNSWMSIWSDIFSKIAWHIKEDRSVYQPKLTPVWEEMKNTIFWCTVLVSFPCITWWGLSFDILKTSFNSNLIVISWEERRTKIYKKNSGLPKFPPLLHQISIWLKFCILVILYMLNFANKYWFCSELY